MRINKIIIRNSSEIINEKFLMTQQTWTEDYLKWCGFLSDEFLFTERLYSYKDS